MEQLESLREKIDKIDAKILELLNKRSVIAKSIGKEKKSDNLFRPERQAFILKKLFNIKNNQIKPEVILSYWSSLFISQVEIQGGLKLLIPRKINNSYLKNIYDYFSHNVKIIKYESINNARKKILHEKNTLLVLPYPGSSIQNNWWSKYQFKNTYIVSTLPFLLKSNQKPNLVIISKYRPELKKDFICFYTSNKIIKSKELSIVAKSSNCYLYKTNEVILKRRIKFIGAMPKHYEI